VKVKLTARKSANGSKRRPLATAVESDRRTGHGVFGDAEAVPSQPVRAGTAAEAMGYVDEGRNNDRAIPEKNVSKKVARKPLALEKYDGSVPLETFWPSFRIVRVIMSGQMTNVACSCVRR